MNVDVLGESGFGLPPLRVPRESGSRSPQSGQPSPSRAEGVKLFPLPLGEGASPKHEVSESEAASLVLRYQDGDAEALALLHGRLSRAIAKLLRRYRSAQLPSTVTPQDLTQQSWVILAELARRWQPSGSFLAYFFRSFPREVEHYLRRAQPGRHTKQVHVIAVPHDELLGAAEKMAAHDPFADRSAAWVDEIASLPAEQRVALLLRTMEGSSFDAIGQTLHVSRASAHRLYRRAVARLSVEFAKSGVA